MSKKFSVIIPTLGRDTLRRTINSIREQSIGIENIEIITWYDPEVSEYVCRNLAAKKSQGEFLAFIDDDAYAHNDWLKNSLKYFEKGAVLVTGPIEGDMFGWGKWIKLDKPRLYVGTNLIVRKSAFLEIGGFDESFGSWRADTDLGYRMEDYFGLDKCIFADDVIVYHPEMMKSHYIHETEIIFAKRHFNKVKEIIAPIDPRIRPIIEEIENKKKEVKK